MARAIGDLFFHQGLGMWGVVGGGYHHSKAAAQAESSSGPKPKAPLPQYLEAVNLAPVKKPRDIAGELRAKYLASPAGKAEIAANEARGREQKKRLDAEKKQAGERMVAERQAAYQKRGGFWGTAVKDFKVLGPVALKAAGTVAAVVATGGAAAGALGAVAAGGVVAGAATASRVIDAVNTGVKVAKVAAAIPKGDLGGVLSAAKDGLSVSGIKVPPLPNAAKIGGEIMAGIDIPKVPKIKLPSAAELARKALQDAKASASASAKSALKQAAKPATAALATGKKAVAATAGYAPPRMGGKGGPAAVAKAKAAVAAAAAAGFKLPTMGKKSTLSVASMLALSRKKLTAVPKAVATIAPVTAATPKASTAKPPKALQAASTIKPTISHTGPKAKPPKVTPKAPTAKAPTAKAPTAKAPTPAVAVGVAREGIFVPLNGVIDLKPRRWLQAES